MNPDLQKHLNECEQTDNHVPSFIHSNGKSTARNAAEAVMLRLGLDLSDLRLREKLIFDINPWVQVEREDWQSKLDAIENGL